MATSCRIQKVRYQKKDDLSEHIIQNHKGNFIKGKLNAMLLSRGKKTRKNND